ncbi:hypothetical protein BUALT_Bualt10G0049600 [Buddleja alternifolia]|uniref:Uncharacterized protein n=1 Tax=Buddleja alternifolia TaxID=168488 RepID=A0AAV6X4U9_9LAMI|nr:hypothetical protein BUALT_Bualt10G0049600 [Buddleja alternifolia]
MSGGSLSPRNDKISVKQRRYPFEGAFFELADFDSTAITPSENNSSALRTSDSQSSEILRTTDLISAVSNAWDHAKQPLSVLLSKNNSTCRTEVFQGSNTLHYSTDEEAFRTSTSADDQLCSNCFNRNSNSVKIVPENLDHLKLNKKMLRPQPSYDFLSFWRILDAQYRMLVESSVENCLSSREIPPNFGSIYGWMRKISIPKPMNQVNSVKIGSKRESSRYTGDFSANLASGCVPADTTSSCDDLTIGISACNPEAAQNVDLLVGEVANVDLKASTAACMENDDVSLRHIEANSRDTNLVQLGHDCGNSNKETEDDLHEYQKDKGLTFFKADSSQVEISLPVKEKHSYALAKQEHAFAGAMAGIFVSLCLHPMDTIKTLIQSCRADEKPLHDIGRIISERGISGLYRGISSNILSSAPISAVYTFTYESVKKSLLPHFPKEYHSLAHCMAGGCASIATSFIFTPSERIKQQMQVGSHYRNCCYLSLLSMQIALEKMVQELVGINVMAFKLHPCRNALTEVVHKGGLPSLYTGWGAVLCRNVPHSIIKFYTYESLKQIMSPSVQSNAPANTLVTLVCGGLSGSMASLFTTPFDVVKTRLQTQIPGSMTRYNGVFNTLTEIGKHEGLKGLYRGLTPRLVMYMIQGALFFASYESFKRLLSLDVRQLSAQTTRREPNTEDGSVMLPSPVSVSA